MIVISKYQLFSLIVLFEIGSTTLYSLGIDAKQDAWIAILISLAMGLCFLWIYSKLSKMFPKKNLAEIIILVLGKGLGVPLAFLYGFFFLYPSTRILREFSELVGMTLLQDTPLLAILIVFLVINLFTLISGIEVLARTSEIILPITLVSIFSVYILSIFSGNTNFKMLTPILGNGILPVLKTSYPLITVLPFGEVLIFTMIWCYVEPQHSVYKISFLALAASGILLALSLIIIISVLGITFASSATIPILEVIKLISLANIITNLDALGVLLILIGGIYKFTIYYIGSILIFSTLFKIKDIKWMLILVSVLFLIPVSITFEPNYPYHIWSTSVTIPAFSVTFLHIIPALLLVISFIRIKYTKLNAPKL